MKKKYIIILSIIGVLIILVGGTYAYFNINTSVSSNGAKVTGTVNDLGTPTIKTVTSNLYLNLNGGLMSEDKAGTTYFANSDSSGTALTENPNYTLAEISLTNGTKVLDCTYNFKVTATVNKSITDGSDSDIKVEVAGKKMTLKELLDAGTTGIIISGKVKNLTNGDKKIIVASSSVTNTENLQDDLVDNSYTITIAPYTNGETKSLNCKLHESISLANELIASNILWQSGLEGDGYRFVGSGTVEETTNPNNFICFGTTDKDKCINDPITYMYRIIGVFEDDNQVNHVKLIKYKQLGEYQWHSTFDDIDWSQCDLNKGLNGSYFLENESYGYFKEEKWLSKITDWKWSSVNTLANESSGPSYFYTSPRGVYQNEILKKADSNVICYHTEGKGSSDLCAVGEWTTSTAKIGLIHASDYVLSLGEKALEITEGIYDSRSIIKTGWIYQWNNDKTYSIFDWTLNRSGSSNTSYLAWIVDGNGGMLDVKVTYKNGVHPVFYLTSDVESSSGTGTLTDPYILQ